MQPALDELRVRDEAELRAPRSSCMIRLDRPHASSRRSNGEATPTVRPGCDTDLFGAQRRVGATLRFKHAVTRGGRCTWSWRRRRRRSTIISTASAASSSVTSISARSRLPKRLSTWFGAAAPSTTACRRRCARAGTRRSCRCCDDRAQAVVAGEAAAVLHLQHRGRQVELVVDDRRAGRARRRSAGRACRPRCPSRSCT